jgi:hypothetical protein
MLKIHTFKSVALYSIITIMCKEIVAVYCKKQVYLWDSHVSI